NVRQYDKLLEMKCYGPDGQGFGARVRNVEEPGPYFHPLVSTLITGAARLMLALVERRAAENGMTWMFCDTDSMALVRPDGVSEGEFIARVDTVRTWFDALNPYEAQEPLFKLEDANYRVENGNVTDTVEP